jgi:hypothetical protein
MTTYNGYESYDHWNTALWLNNDDDAMELLQNIVEPPLWCICQASPNTQAVEQLLNRVPAKTPDGAAWQKETILDLIDEHYQEQLQWS